MRIYEHPILGPLEDRDRVSIEVDGRKIKALSGEPIAAALFAEGILVCRETARRHEPRGVFCGIGQCTDCMMTVDGKPNIRTCITPVRDGMKIETQEGHGKWSDEDG
jgi:predicted molibdopterin-dependent oxidoreductase YjgC